MRIIQAEVHLCGNTFSTNSYEFLQMPILQNLFVDSALNSHKLEVEGEFVQKYANF